MLTLFDLSNVSVMLFSFSPTAASNPFLNVIHKAVAQRYPFVQGQLIANENILLLFSTHYFQQVTANHQLT